MPIVFRAENAHRVFSAIGRENMVVSLRHQRACHTRETRNRVKIAVFCTVDHIDAVIRSMRDIETVEPCMDGRMVKATILDMNRQLNVTNEF
jgi:hypothetical protein